MHQRALLPRPIEALLVLELVLLVLAWRFGTLRAPLLVVALAALLVVVVWCILELPARLIARDTAIDELQPDQRATAVNGARSAVVQGVVGSLALLAVGVAWWQLQTDRQRLRAEQQRSTIERQHLSEQLT